MGFMLPIAFRSDLASTSGGTIPTGGLVLDLDARSNVYNDDGTTLATNGQTVEEWHTTDAGAYVFSGATSFKPTYFSSSADFNNEPYIRFLGAADGLAQYLLAPYDVNFEIQDQTIFLVAKNTDSSLNTSFNHFFMFGETVEEGYHAYLGNTSGTEFEYTAGDWGADFVDITQTSEQSYIYQMRYEQSTSLNARLDDGTQNTDTAAASISYTQTTIDETGFLLGAGFSSGTIARELSCNITRLLVYDRYMDDTERDEVLETLNAIYNTH